MKPSWAAHLTGNRQLRARPAGDGLMVGGGFVVGDRVADGLAEARGVVLAMGTNAPVHAANANTTTGSKTLFTSIQRWRAGPVTRG